jgi:hypothetical protein
VINEGTSLAPPPADPQLGIKLLERARAELGKPSQRGIADCGLEEIVDRYP